MKEESFENVKASIVFKGHGTVTFELYHEYAPITVEHFVKLAENHDFDGAKINRYQAGFVLQGGVGCKDNSTIKGEFASNGVNNPITHEKGVISMARSQNPDSASNQFFIVLDDSAKRSLDGSYAAFGKVIEGWEVIESICNSFTSSDFSNDYYGIAMGFLKETSYITIKTIVIER